MNKALRIIFMGTPDFAVPALEILVENQYNVVAVITAADKPAGRGLQLQQSPVKKFALEKGIPVLQPARLKDPAFLEELTGYQADIQVVVAFRMLPEAIWAMPQYGTFNLHASLLPDYRGAAPINWAIIRGEKETGLTTFFLKHEIDTGDLIYQKRISIGPDETAGELHDRMMREGAEVVLKTIASVTSGSIQTKPQPMPRPNTEAPKIFKETCRISWDKPVDDIYNLIRGLSPYPAAWTLLDDKVFKIYRAAKEVSDHSLIPGSISTDAKSYLKVAVPGGYLSLTDVQVEGKKRMSIADFLRGYQVKTKTVY